MNIQLDQLPKNCKYLQDILIPNRYSKSGFSQIDHVVITPYAIFVVETKNYTGTIYGERSRAKWSVNGKFPMMNPFNQNYGHIQAIKGVLQTMDDTQFVSMVSINKRCTFKVNEELRKIQSNDLIVYDTELSEFIKRKINVLKLQHRKPRNADDDIQDMYNKLKVANITDLQIRNEHVEKLKNKDSEESVKKEKLLSTCKVCGKVVSEKVKSYCLSNKNRFKGNIYCYEHQKPHQ
ncbi:nuclease-related domain-containing protein [Bacillus sp. S/N-304-OC-R1]|uniref:nuclease-related domain-containing protein n=1 Tax=Bacillus sp. S/N-304-OC-R1 TaxID=2758034 RepID=UPI0028BE2733|nr:nuclease-related domain-containing protein [Bacillus sp. S/N-304-OC-R1]